MSKTEADVEVWRENRLQRECCRPPASRGRMEDGEGTEQQSEVVPLHPPSQSWGEGCSLKKSAANNLVWRENKVSFKTKGEGTHMKTAGHIKKCHCCKQGRKAKRVAIQARM